MYYLTSEGTSAKQTLTQVFHAGKHQLASWIVILNPIWFLGPVTQTARPLTTASVVRTTREIVVAVRAHRAPRGLALVLFSKTEKSLQNPFGLRGVHTSHLGRPALLVVGMRPPLVDCSRPLVLGGRCGLRVTR